MGWGTSGNVTTVHLNSGSDDPSQARTEIYNAFIELQAVIGGRGTSNGVAPLGSDSKVANTYLPDTLTSSFSTDLTVAPATARTVFQNIISLTPRSVAQLSILTANAGDIAFCSDGDAGQPCLAVCKGTTDSNGTEWFRISLGTQISIS